MNYGAFFFFLNSQSTLMRQHLGMMKMLKFISHKLSFSPVPSVPKTYGVAWSNRFPLLLVLYFLLDCLPHQFFVHQHFLCIITNYGLLNPDGNFYLSFTLTSLQNSWLLLIEVSRMNDQVTESFRFNTLKYITAVYDEAMKTFMTKCIYIITEGKNPFTAISDSLIMVLHWVVCFDRLSLCLTNYNL